MNFNPSAKRIICYGDSNTWGQEPITRVRYPANVRWTGVLQEKLGNDYEIIEEGLCGRTTTLDDPKEADRNGKTFLPTCLRTHDPIDCVILMLGSNDLKKRFNLTAEEISKNIEELCLIIKETVRHGERNEPNIILVSPAHIKEFSDSDDLKGAEEKSKMLGRFIEEVSKRQNCAFIDIAQHAEPSPKDGCHFEAESHAKIGEVLADKVKTVFNS